MDPPYLIRTERLALRCWEPADAPLLHEAIVASLPELREWMPWAHAEPIALAERVELLRRFRGTFDLGQDFVYGIFAPDGSRVLGGTGLHPRSGDGSLEIGYWIRSDSVGCGLATEAAGCLTRVAIETCSVDRVEIHVEPGNERSRAIPQRLGFTEEATLRRRLDAAGGGPRRDVVVFTLFAEELPGSPAAATPFEAFDASGAPVR